MVNSVSQRGRDQIKQFEGCRLDAYRDQAGVATIGYGHTQAVALGLKITQEEAEQYFEKDVADFAMRVRACLTREPSQEQFDALCSLAFNIGVGAFKGSTVWRQFNAADDIAAANAFGLWNKMRVDGKLVESPGLTRRRATEKALYLEGVAQESPHALAEVVPEEKPLQASGTLTGAKVGTAAGVLTGITALVDQVQQTAMNLPWLGDIARFMVANQPKLVGVFALSALGAIGYMAWRRIHDREQGRV